MREREAIRAGLSDSADQRKARGQGGGGEVDHVMRFDSPRRKTMQCRLMNARGQEAMETLNTSCTLSLTTMR